MIKHTEVKQMPLSQFSGLESGRGCNYTSDPPSILTSYSNRPKSNECKSQKDADPFSPDLPIRKLNPEESRPRYLLGPCMHERHTQCPGFKIREILRFGRPTGRTEKKYCECRCHAGGNLV